MNYLEEAGNWLGLPSESPINESSINFFSAYTARKLKIGTNVAKFVTNYHKMDNDTIKGLESTIKLAKKQIKELEIEQEKFVNSDEKYKEKLIKKFKKYNPNKTWSDNNIKKYYKDEIEFNNKIINKCEKELKYIQVNNESYIEESKIGSMWKSIKLNREIKNIDKEKLKKINNAIKVYENKYPNTIKFNSLKKEKFSINTVKVEELKNLMIKYKSNSIIAYSTKDEYIITVLLNDNEVTSVVINNKYTDDTDYYLLNIISKTGVYGNETPKLIDDILNIKEADIEESYTPERGEVKVNKINTLANLARNYGIENSGNLRDDIVSECTDILDCLDTVEESVVNKDISLLPVYTVNEGYAVDLESLKYVVESKECTLQEAIQEVRDVNYIGDTIPMYCTLPKNINENMTLESFITLNDSLNEAGIIPVSTREFSELEFVQESMISDIMDKIKNKMDSQSKSSLEKKIKECETNNEELRNELEKVKKMSDEEATKYVTGQSAKNIAKIALSPHSIIPGAAAGYLLVVAPSVGCVAYFAAIMYSAQKGYEKGLTKDGKFASDVKSYKKAINNTITLNNALKSAHKKKLKELESKK